MPKIRMRDASLPLAMALACTVPVSVSAQLSVSEDEAIQRALEREDISARDDADRSISLAEIGIVGPRDNPSVEMSREAAGGENEWQIGIVQPIDLNGRRSSLVGAATADAAATDADISRRRQDSRGRGPQRLRPMCRRPRRIRCLAKLHRGTGRGGACVVCPRRCRRHGGL